MLDKIRNEETLKQLRQLDNAQDNPETCLALTKKILQENQSTILVEQAIYAMSAMVEKHPEMAAKFARVITDNFDSHKVAKLKGCDERYVDAALEDLAKKIGWNDAKAGEDVAEVKDKYSRYVDRIIFTKYEKSTYQLDNPKELFSLLDNEIDRSKSSPNELVKLAGYCAGVVMQESGKSGGKAASNTAEALSLLGKIVEQSPEMVQWGALTLSDLSKRNENFSPLVMLNMSNLAEKIGQQQPQMAQYCKECLNKYAMSKEQVFSVMTKNTGKSR